MASVAIISHSLNLANNFSSSKNLTLSLIRRLSKYKVITCRKSCNWSVLLQKKTSLLEILTTKREIGFLYNIFYGFSLLSCFILLLAYCLQFRQKNIYFGHHICFYMFCADCNTKVSLFVCFVFNSTNTFTLWLFF